MWEVRGTSLKELNSTFKKEKYLLDSGFALLNNVVAIFPLRTPILKTAGVLVIKARALIQSIYSLSLDGHGQEAGALLRVLVESYETLRLLETKPDQLKRISEGKLTGGNISKLVSVSPVGMRKFLSDTSSHLSLGTISIQHLLEVDPSMEEIRLRKEMKFSPKSFASNMLLVISYLKLISHVSLELLYLEGETPDKLGDQYLKYHGEVIEFLDSR